MLATCPLDPDICETWLGLPAMRCGGGDGGGAAAASAVGATVVLRLTTAHGTVFDR